MPDVYDDEENAAGEVGVHDLVLMSSLFCRFNWRKYSILTTEGGSGCDLIHADKNSLFKSAWKLSQLGTICLVC